ncbi:MAG: hypothetical protein EA378_04020 [Phycisphaerales bacterium]|nr:MAG: hypothetical protein EA378_04020 [Phycisphaerales bacterium]
MKTLDNARILWIETSPGCGGGRNPYIRYCPGREFLTGAFGASHSVHRCKSAGVQQISGGPRCRRQPLGAVLVGASPGPVHGSSPGSGQAPFQFRMAISQKRSTLMQFTRTGSAAAALFMIAGFAVGTTQAQDLIQWRSGDPAEIAQLEGRAPLRTLTDASRNPDASRVVLQFSRPLLPAERAQLEAAGVTLLASLGPNGFFANVAPHADAQAAINAAPLTVATPVVTDWKLHPTLARGETPSWSVTAVADAFNPEITLDNPMVAVNAQFHRDVDITDPALIEDLLAQGIEIEDTVHAINTLVLQMPRRMIDRVAADDRVQWLEPPIPALSELNDDNRVRTQSNEAQSNPYSLSGEGVTVFVFDGGRARETHTDFAGRVSIFGSSGISNHATHVAGTVLGSGAASANNFRRGMAPAATLVSSGFQSGGGGVFLYTNPGNLVTDYNQAINNFNADISNNSIGTNTSANGFPCEITGEYGLTAATIDAIARGSLGKPIVIFWAAGNERGVTRCGTSYGSTAPPGNHKNGISVGALNSNNDTMTNFSSWGPSNDGRIRPTISAPGCQSNGDGGVTSASSNSNTAYTTLCGTSMASPTAAGVGALIYEDFRNLHGSEAVISNQLMKVFLIMGAVDLGNRGPDNQFGYGSIRTVESIDFLRSGNWDEDEIAGTGSVVVYGTEVPAGQNELTITLAWDDAPGTANVNPSLVNDLDLVVIDPAGNRHYPWTVNPASPGSPAVRNTVDRLNNIEQVTVDNPIPGTWRVEVLGHAVPEGPQTFAIGATNALASDFLALSSTTALPALSAPGEPITVSAAVTLGNDTRLGPVTAFFRTDGGSFNSIEMNNLGDENFEITLPGALCDSTLDFFLEVEGENAGIVRSPALGAAQPFSIPVGEILTWAHETFEDNDGGWIGGLPTDTAVRGQWEWGIPEQTNVGGEIVQPGTVVTPGGQRCWVTGAAAGPNAGAWDVDEGETTLVTRVYDLNGSTDAVLSYYRWYSNHAGASPFNDIFVIDISNDAGATWQNLETIGPSGAEVRGGWIYAEFNLANVFPGQSLDRVQLRFIASDYDPQALVEAAIDEFMIVEFTCNNPEGCASDLTGPALDGVPDGAVTIADLNYFLAAWVDGDATIADVTGPTLDGIPDGAVTIADLNYFAGLWLTESAEGCAGN